MKNGFFKASRCYGYILRRLRTALMISVVSSCFVVIHYFMKDHWTEKFSLHGGKRNVMNMSQVNSGSISVYPRSHFSTMLARLPVTRSLSVISQASTPRYQMPLKTHRLPEKDDLWLTEFTPGLPQNLAKILQTILTRDFERSKAPSRDAPPVARCRKGFFRLKGMNSCRKWLGCSEINSLERGKTSGTGVGKIVQISQWNGLDVAIISLRQDRVKYKMFVTRVESGVGNMLMVQPSPYATQVVGVCNKGNNTVLVSEFCKNGNFAFFYFSPEFRRLSSEERLKFAIQMIASFDYLHRGFSLPRVHCDLHAVMQAFGQWVVSEDHRLFLSDLDELPAVDKEKNVMATCEREPYGKMEMPTFLAPEARYTQVEFDKELPLKQLDQNSDVWKFPDLFANIMDESPGIKHLQTLANLEINYYFKHELENIHKRCKSHDPSRRPSSREVLIEYLKLYERKFVKENFDSGSERNKSTRQ